MEKQTIEVANIDISRDDLFGELGSVIKMLSEIKNRYKNGESIYLNEEWSGYEDNYFDITVTREETDEEYKERIDLEEKARLKEEEKQKLKLAKEEEKRKENIRMQINKLKKQL